MELSSIASLGVVVIPDFLPDDLRLRTLAAAATATPTDLEVYRRGSGLKLIPDVRDSQGMRIPSSLRAELDELAASIAPALPADFIPEDAAYLPFLKVLRYQNGGHFRIHSDAPGVPLYKSAKEVGVRTAVVLLGLNDPSEYVGGDLELYGLVGSGEDNPFAHVGIPIRVPAGTAISFRADTLHAVRPVTSGQRFLVSASFGKTFEDRAAYEASLVAGQQSDADPRSD